MASLQDSRPFEIFQYFDQDKDGFLNYTELSALQLKTSGVAMTKRQWKQVCGTFGLNPKTSGLTLEHILVTYASGSADIEEDYMAVFPGRPQPLSPEKVLKGLEESVFSDPVLIPGMGPVDIEALDPAALVNTLAERTRFGVSDDGVDRFNRRFRTALKAQCAVAGVDDELKAWLDTGLSNGRPLRLQVMALKPNTHWKVHAHPNLEFEWTLLGTLKEVRLKGALPTTDYPVVPDAPEGLVTAIEGPDLSSPAAGEMAFEAREVPGGKFMVNPVGSLHQSYTGEDGALVLVLWSGCHANVRPERCTGLTGPGSDLLKPGEGWATAK